jgi:hypothetical protein
MKYRQLDKNGPTVSAIDYNAMVISPGIYYPVKEEESLTTNEADNDAIPLVGRLGRGLCQAI